MTLGLAILGAGRIGKVHAKAILAQPAASLVAVADAHAPSADALAAILRRAGEHNRSDLGRCGD